MMKGILIAFTLASVAVLQVASEQASCALTADNAKTTAMVCMAHAPMLAIKIAEHMNDLSSIESLDFVCSNQKDVVKMLMCVEDKVVKCMPQGGKMLSDLLPNQVNMARGLKMMCDNRNLLQDNCMDASVSQDFIKCYMGKVQGIMTSSTFQSPAEIKNGLCSVIASDEYCFREHHGSCSQKFIKEVFNIIEAFFPIDQCSPASLRVENIKGKLNGPLSSMLLKGVPMQGGMPLQFESEKGRKYNYYN